VWEFLEGTLLKEMELSSAEFASVYGLTEVWNVGDIAEKYFRPRVGTAIKLMTSTDKKLLTNFIFSNSGMNERPLARAILKQPNLSSIVDNSGFRARRIIRTERHRMTWGSSLEFAKGAGSQTKEWVTVGDGRVRPAHQAQNGEIVAIDEAFTNGEQYPGENDINCRCHLNYGFEKKRKEAFTGLPDAKLGEIYS
ncbi:MAG: phage minor head protein, partial [Bacteroidales bacterium]